MPELIRLCQWELPPHENNAVPMRYYNDHNQRHRDISMAGLNFSIAENDYATFLQRINASATPSHHQIPTAIAALGWSNSENRDSSNPRLPEVHDRRRRADAVTLL